MKKWHFLMVAFCSFAAKATAQLPGNPTLIAEVNAVSNRPAARPFIKPDSVFSAPDVLPQFTGGAEALKEFLAKNVRYPAQAQRMHVSGRVYVHFMVDQEGKISDVSLVKGPGSGLNEEALRLVWFMPRWQPGRHQGQAVKTFCTIPISFDL